MTNDYVQGGGGGGEGTNSHYMLLWDASHNLSTKKVLESFLHNWTDSKLDLFDPV
jgi:hypothetical protein